MSNEINFNILISSIHEIDKNFVLQTKRAININLTLRNWFIGAYIYEYELNGSDRAEYGEKLLFHIEKKLENLSNCNRRQLYEYIQFYKIYHQIVPTVSAQLKSPIFSKIHTIIEKVPTVSAQSLNYTKTLLNKLSYSMFKLLIQLTDNNKRIFYELESIKNGWSVRELKRQINSLYYERMGLSINREKFLELASSNVEHEKSIINIQDPFVFEFLGLKAQEVMSESHLEDKLLNNIQNFLLELGHGFCFEARQKRILIGDNHYFVDMVFYHRVLKCHVLIELKLAEFNHENIGQLNTYLNWYKENMMLEVDNPPIGILLCTNKDHALVKYALAGMDDNLFVSKYQLELPKKEDMEKFIEEKLKEAELGGKDE